MLIGRDVGQMAGIEQSQIDLINRNRFSVIVAMMIASVLIYFGLRSQAGGSVLIYWLYVIVSVDIFRLYTVFLFKRARKTNRVDYGIAGRHILIGTILSGACLASLAVIMIPLADMQGILAILFALVVITITSTITLAYRLKFSVIFILLVLTPVILILPVQEKIVGTDLLLYELAIMLMMALSLKLATSFSQSVEQLLDLEIKSHEQNVELALQRESAECANHAKSDFLAKMSHELRTPMHAILGFSSLGVDIVGTASNEKILGYFSRINESGQRLLILIDDLLDLSKLEAGRTDFEFTTNNLRYTIKNVIDELVPLFKKRSLKVKLETTSLDTVATYDDDRIAQVVRNLLSNAIKFAAEKSEITVYFKAEELDVLTDGTLSKKVSAVSVSVYDRGLNIPEDELESVFNVFQQSRKKDAGAGGTGLGLSICREIIGNHGGQIKASNATEGDGVIFTFILPYKPIVKNTA